jgi:hypothetical protein
MEQMYYNGLDVHKKKVSYCVKDVSSSNLRFWYPKSRAGVHRVCEHIMMTRLNNKLPRRWRKSMKIQGTHDKKMVRTDRTTVRPHDSPKTS